MKEQYKKKVRKAFFRAFTDSGDGRIILTEKMPNNKKKEWEVEAHTNTIWEFIEKVI